MNETQFYEEEIVTSDVDSLSKAVVRTLLYFDIFDYPLTETEISRYCQRVNADPELVRNALEQLTDEGFIFRFEEMYSLQNNYALVERRLAGNRKAKKFLHIARIVSKLISWFPYVRGVYLSGSLSKGYADKRSDIDYFIITAPGRLWLCRTLLITFKKIFLFNSRKYFCLNYFIDTDHLEIPDKNIFTATELAFIIPTYNESLYADLMHANEWERRYYPNLNIVEDFRRKKSSVPFFKNIMERIFDGDIGNRLEKYFFGLTVNHWNEKFKTHSAEQMELNFRSRPYVSKHHPQGMQMRVLQRLEDKIRAFENRFQLKLT